MMGKKAQPFGNQMDRRGVVVRFEERIHKFEYKLNDTDDQIIAYILKHKKDVVTLSIQALAARLFTVPNTIIRLSKKLGYDGFSQLKNSLKEEIRADWNEPEDSLHFNIQKTMQLIDMDRITLVAKLIHEAERVLVFGVGDTAPVCDMVVRDLRITRKHAEFHVHRHETMQECHLLTPHDLLFLISLSGETPQVLEVAELAKSKGIRIVSLTHFSRNSLQRIADVKLYCYSPKKMIKQYNVTDRTPVMIVLRVLAETYWKMAGVCV
jgi:DNA-binding MurR/RpiR family transcriptional regulator